MVAPARPRTSRQQGGRCGPSDAGPDDGAGILADSRARRGGRRRAAATRHGARRRLAIREFCQTAAGRQRGPSVTARGRRCSPPPAQNGLPISGPPQRPRSDAPAAVGMVGKQVPSRQGRPCSRVSAASGFDPARARGRQERRRLRAAAFHGYSLTKRPNGGAGGIEEVAPVPADLRHAEQGGSKPARAALSRSQPSRPRSGSLPVWAQRSAAAQPERRPGLRQRRLDVVELPRLRIGGAEALQPFPLQQGGLAQAGGAVGPDIQQPGRPAAVPAQVEPAEQAGFAAFPGADGDRPGAGGNASEACRPWRTA